MLVSQIIATLEEQAPLALQEDYDNSGLIVGAPAQECTGALLTVDVTPDIVREARDKGCNLIISHHPLTFKGLKRLNGRTPVEQSVIEAIRAGIAIYACHTSMDNAAGGVSHRMATKLGLDNISVLDPQLDRLVKLSVYVPDSHADEVRLALFDAGAGRLGNYDSCSYSTQGTGTFRATAGANPYVGEIGEMHSEAETRIEVLLPSWRRHAVENALLQTHPYEEPAYEFINIANASRHTGSGAVGNLQSSIPAAQLVALVKEAFGSPVARCSRYPLDNPIRRVALCGGSGSFLIGKAIAAGAQAFITSDTKYHDFVDHGDSILIIDIGHHESENCTKEIFYHRIKEIFPNFAVKYSEKDTNPINYL